MFGYQRDPEKKYLGISARVAESGQELEQGRMAAGQSKRTVVSKGYRL